MSVYKRCALVSDVFVTPEDHARSRLGWSNNGFNIINRCKICSTCPGCILHSGGAVLCHLRPQFGHLLHHHAYCLRGFCLRSRWPVKHTGLVICHIGSLCSPASTTRTYTKTLACKYVCTYVNTPHKTTTAALHKIWLCIV